MSSGNKSPQTGDKFFSQTNLTLKIHISMINKVMKSNLVKIESPLF